MADEQFLTIASIPGEVEPWDVAAAQITGAVAFASLASRLAGGHAQASFAKMAESLAEASSREM